MTVSTGQEAPVERTRVGLGRPLRVALVYGRHEESRRTVARIVLAAAAELHGVMPADDPRSLVEQAQAFRDAAPDVVVVHPADAKDALALTVFVEALRLGCGPQRPAPRVFVLSDPHVAEVLRPASGQFPFETFADPVEVVRALRDHRRDTSADVTLRDELVEGAARALASSTTAAALAVDVSERSTSLVLARPDGMLEAAHLVPLGLGEAADHVVARAGLDRVRRWLPWPIDAPALLERVFNRARWPGALPATSTAVLLEMALARESIAHALRDAEYAGLDVAAMRAAPSILVTGRAASFPRPGQTVLALVDSLEPEGITTVYREPDNGRAVRLALVVSLWPRREMKLRFVRAAGPPIEERVKRGSFSLIAIGGDVSMSAAGARFRGHGQAGALGVLIDARGRPLSLPERDGERIPALSRWHAMLRVSPAGRG